MNRLAGYLKNLCKGEEKTWDPSSNTDQQFQNASHCPKYGYNI